MQNINILHLKKPKIISLYYNITCSLTEEFIGKLSYGIFFPSNSKKLILSDSNFSNSYSSTSNFGSIKAFKS